MLTVFTDEYFMMQAIKEAEKAALADEVPIGAVIVCKNNIIAKSHNQTEVLNDVTAHAEILAITSACAHLGSKYLKSCTMYVTMEPCVMCAGAIFWSQIGKVVFGASDDKRGFMMYGKELLHPKTKLEFGVCHEQCGSMVRHFFAKKR
ncbi:MAG: nucleoside deaminase [Saprospiraceae bacterium]|nr:nucleoside deaminase [Saprospiraceae bacterium]